MSEPYSSYANGSFTSSTSVSGTNNITTIMRDTLGVLILGILSLVMLAELRRMYDLNRALANKCCENGCNCACHKQAEAGNQ